MPIEWKLLVEEAKNSDIGFEKLIVELEPILYSIARRLANDSMVEDLVQLSRIKIWQSLSSVNLKRSETIKQFLVNTGVNVIKDYLRCQGRFNYANVDEIIVIQPTCGDVFSGLLGEYLDYIKINSTFAGSHQYLAARYGVSVWVIRGRFHKAVGEFLEKINNE